MAGNYFYRDYEEENVVCHLNKSIESPAECIFCGREMWVRSILIKWSIELIKVLLLEDNQCTVKVVQRLHLANKRQKICKSENLIQ